MIDITDKHKCCGCSACVQACPKQCISFNEDEQGFSYPLVNKERCIDCGLCERVCPCLNQNESRKPLKVYAAINPNEDIRMQSSSGGIFTLLAEAIIEEGGVVFGARFDENWEVKHDCTETIEGLSSFRGSKYVQSRIGETYKQTRDFLKAGRKVLFSGTSCQIMGLKKFLRKEYDNLLTVDVVCHGVPSPLVWREYLETLQLRPKGVVGRNSVLLSLKEKPVITGISFRDKSTGWKKFGFVVRGKSASKADQNTVLSSYDEIILHETVDKNLYMQGFINNLIIRPSCFTCPAKQGRCHSDFSLADFWAFKVHTPHLNDDKGITLLYVHTENALNIVRKLNIRFTELDREQELNIAFSRSTKEKFPAQTFWNLYSQRSLQSIQEVCTKIRPSVVRRFLQRIILFIRRKLA